ncbi:DNA/RNA helicase domain-containing protein [Malacoplasma muris]|uniref:DNA/RNA helicase domain-containing protein n=1 Tax=Malacoplasma muris TaxID=2119 RepID=UPI00398E42E6
MNLNFEILNYLLNKSKLNDKYDFELFKKNYKEILKINCLIDIDKFAEIKSIYEFLSLNDFGNSEYRKKINFSCLEKVFICENDLFFHFFKDELNIFINVEIKSKDESNEAQLKRHMLQLKKYILGYKKCLYYGVSYNQNTKKEIVFVFNEEIKKIYINKSFNNLLLLLETNNYNSHHIPSSSCIKLVDTFNKIKDISTNDVDFSNAEITLINNINNSIEYFDFIIIDAEAGVGKTLFCFYFLVEFLKKNIPCQLLIHNYRVMYKIKEARNDIFFKNTSYIPDDLSLKLNYLLLKRILIVDEAQKLDFEKIIEYKNKFKKIILFGDKYQNFCNKRKGNDYDKIHELLTTKGYKVKKIQYKCDVKRRFSQHYPITVKYILNDIKFKLPDYIIKNDIEIKVFNDLNEFIKSYNFEWNSSRKIAYTIYDKNENLNLIKNYNLKNFMSKDFPLFAYADNKELCGTSYNLISFEIKDIYIISTLKYDEIINNKIIFNDFYTLMTRAKNKVYLYFHDFETRKKILERINEVKLHEKDE